MKRFIAFVLVFMLAFPVAAESIDLSGLTYYELQALRDEIDARMKAIKTATENNDDEPNYNELNLEVAIEQIALRSDDGVCHFRNYEFYPGEELHIHVDMKNLYDNRNTISDTICFSIDFARRAFLRDDITMIRFFFHEAGRNSYGQQVDMQTITMKIKKTTFQKINIDYIYKWPATNQLLYLNALDAYTLYKDYKRVVK